MIKRTIVVSNPCLVRLRQNQLVLEHNGEELGRVPCEDIGVLVLEDAQISVTRSALARCVELNAVVLLCDARHLPVALLQPIQANTMHAKVLRQQIAASEAVHKRIWKQIVACKIHHQALIVDRKQGDARHLFQLSARVRLGDQGNLEAQAARVYWKQMFGDEFRRRRDGAGTNNLLNYAYAVLRAVLARAVCAGGLHPALGVHHSNQYNPFALADDLLEPLRPMADSLVHSLISSNAASPVELTPERKSILLGLTAQDCVVDGKQLPLMVALQSYVTSFRAVLCRESKEIAFPAI